MPFWRSVCIVVLTSSLAVLVVAVAASLLRGGADAPVVAGLAAVISAVTALIRLLVPTRTPPSDP